MPAESDNQCCICLRNRIRNRVQTPCRHFFCRRCLRRCYYEGANKNCPLCRTPINFYYRKYNTFVKVVFFF